MFFSSPNWLDWYRAKHLEKCMLTGSDFEHYFELVMKKRFADYTNPDPAGQHGDGGCDGIKDYGESAFACYGSRAIQNAERALVRKINGDFGRAVSTWDEMNYWRFVTNATFGPNALKTVVDLQREHRTGSNRPININIWDEQRLWDEVVKDLEASELNEVFPGVPGSENIELADMLPLLNELAVRDVSRQPLGPVRDVQPTKLDYNEIPPDTRIELNSGRKHSAPISDWFDGQADPVLEDTVAAKFRSIYFEHKSAVSDPKEVVERLYISVGGSNIRLDSKRAESVYAITAYFFDACHIFEEPPPGWGAATSGEGGVAR